MSKILVSLLTVLLILAMATPVWAADLPSATINVTGTGKVTAVPDLTMITFQVITDEINPLKAQQMNNEKMDLVYASLGKLGIDKKDIQTISFNIAPIWEYNETTRSNVLANYRVTNSIQVTMHQIEQVGQVINAVTEAGVNSIRGLSFDVNDRAPYRLQALKAAAEDAKQQAETVALALGMKLGSIRQVNIENSYDYPRPIAYEMDGYAMKAGAAAAPTPISPNDIDITARVSVVYELVK